MKTTGPRRPKSDEPVSDPVASLALDSGELEIVVRYLRETAVPAIRKCFPRSTLVTLHKLADMLERRSNVKFHFQLRRNAEFNPADSYIKTLCRLKWAAESIGVKRAFAKERVSKTKGYEAIKEWERYREHQQRHPDQAIAIPKSRRRSGRRIKAQRKGQVNR
jgi:hypothetical protein